MTQNLRVTNAVEAVPERPGRSEPTARSDEEATSVDTDSTATATSTAHVDGDESDDLAKQARKAAKKAAKAVEKAERLARKAHEETAAREASKAAAADAAAEETEVEPSEKRKLSFESSMNREEVASYLESIVEGLRKGSLHFRKGDDSLALSPADRVEIEVKAARKRGREKLSFEVEWRTDERESLAIVSDEDRDERSESD